MSNHKTTQSRKDHACLPQTPGPLNTLHKQVDALYLLKNLLHKSYILILFLVAGQ